MHSTHQGSEKSLCTFAPRKASPFKAALVSNQLLWGHHMLQSTLIMTAYIQWHFLWYTKKSSLICCLSLFRINVTERECSRTSKSLTRMTSWMWEKNGSGKEEKSTRRVTVVEYADSFLQVTLSVIYCPAHQVFDCGTCLMKTIKSCPPITWRALELRWLIIILQTEQFEQEFKYSLDHTIQTHSKKNVFL